MHPLELSLPVPVLIVEDDPTMQTRIADLLMHIGYQAEHLRYAQTLQHAQQQLDDHSASFALVDLGLPDGNGIDFIHQLKQYDPSILVLVISGWSTEDAILKALEAGATGYVLKERDDVEISLAIRSILRGGAPIDPFVAQKILKQLQSGDISQTIKKNDPSILTKREYEILVLVAQGLSNKEISQRLNLSRYTVESHIKHIYRKLAVCNRTKAIDTARNMGFL